MDAPTAAAIASICAAVVALGGLVAQVYVAQKVGSTHTLVDGQSKQLQGLIRVASFAEGQLAGPTPTVGPLGATAEGPAAPGFARPEAGP